MLIEDFVREQRGSLVSFKRLDPATFTQFNAGSWSYIDFKSYVEKHGLVLDKFVVIDNRTFNNIFYIDPSKGIYKNVTLSQDYFDLSYGLPENRISMVDALSALEKNKNEYIEAGKYLSFYFYCVPETFKIFDFQDRKRYLDIPKDDVFKVWKDIHTSLDFSFSKWDEDILDYVFSCAPTPTNLHKISTRRDSLGRIQIYRGVSNKDYLSTGYLSWTSRFSSALWFASRFAKNAAVFAGYVRLENIVAYIENSSESEVIVRTKHVEDIVDLGLIIPTDEYLYRTLNVCKSEFRRYTRIVDWEYSLRYSSEISGVHDLSHIRRVLLNALLILKCSGETFTEQEEHLITDFAMFHDIGRDNDFEDPDHGEKSVCYLAENVFEIDEDLEIINLFIKYHSRDDEDGLAALERLEGYSDKEKDRLRYLFMICKDADALDRVRLNDLEYDYLRTGFAKKLPLVSYSIFMNLE